MQTLAIAYGLAWGGVWAYVLWLGVQQGRLRQRLEKLQSELASEKRPYPARAA